MIHSTDAVRDFLASRGCDEATVDRGLEGLLADWETLTSGVADTGYVLGLSPYLGEMDGRELLEGALKELDAGARTRVRPRLVLADNRMLEATVPCGTCLWGDDIASDHHWDPVRQWWYFRVPKDYSMEFEGDLETAGIELLAE